MCFSLRPLVCTPSKLYIYAICDDTTLKFCPTDARFMSGRAGVFIRLNYLKYFIFVYICCADKQSRERKAMFILNIVPNYAHICTIHEHIILNVRSFGLFNRISLWQVVAIAYYLIDLCGVCTADKCRERPSILTFCIQMSWHLFLFLVYDWISLISQFAYEAGLI